jgi:uncharacterized protein (DUF2141 family)
MASLDITVTNIRNDKGIIRIAICPPDKGFPECGAGSVRTGSFEIVDGKAKAHFPGIPEGIYAVSVFHDANENSKLDTMLGIPREGYGFSNNPSFKPRAPRFSEAQIEVTERTKAEIRLRYLF